MVTQLHDTGEEALLDAFFEESLSKPSSVSITLFNDSTDALTDSSDLGDISTEPTGSAFARQTASFGTTDFSNQDNSGDWETIIADKTFDTSDSNQSVDSYAVIISFTSDDTGDSSANEHLLFTGSLNQSYNLGDIDTFTLSGSGISLT
ncbi:hypothetical protein [Halosegnis longus]|uniref:hypothetical protein n=1 Tax=Halosegnis longus TaxID=2216012 RepID=UPI00129E5183|nr:hypothetical protein [Halosegnis longus]